MGQDFQSSNEFKEFLNLIVQFYFIPINNVNVEYMISIMGNI